MFPELAQVSLLADYFDTDYICNVAGNELKSYHGNKMRCFSTRNGLIEKGFNGSKLDSSELRFLELLVYQKYVSEKEMRERRANK